MKNLVSSFSVILLSLLLLLAGSTIAMAQTSNQDSIRQQQMLDSVLNLFNLQEVTVSAKLPQTRIKGDALVSRVAGSTLANAGTAEDMLAQVPGMMRQNGQLQVIGKGVPVYYINGRKVQDLTELQRLSSKDIREVEVINNPGAQYDAQTNAVVRIRTIRRDGEGFGGTADIRDEFCYRWPNNRFGSNLSLNYRHGSLDIFGGIGLDDHYLDYFNAGVDQELRTDHGTYNQRGDITTRQHYLSLKGNLGLNWQINENHSLGFRLDRNDNLIGSTDFTMNESVFIDDTIGHEHIIADTHTDTDGMDTWALNTYYSGHAGDLGIDLNFDYYGTTQKSRAFTDEHLYLSDIQNHVNNRSEAKANMLATKLIFSYPVWIGKLSVGTELVFLLRNNTYASSLATISSDSSCIRDNTYAVFAEYAMEIPKAGVLNLGLRYEYNDFRYQQFLDPSQDMTRHKSDFFPNISFATRIKELQGTLSYTIHTRRPNFHLLRSTVEYGNYFTFTTGNPKLQNEINHQVALNLRWRYLALSTSYECKINGIYDWTYPYGDDGRVLLSWVNLSKPINRFSMFFNASPTVGCWSPSYTLGVQKQWLTFSLADPLEETGFRTVSYNKPMFICNLFNRFSVKSKKGSPWQLELNSALTSTCHYGNAEITKWSWNLSFGFQKSWLENDALTLRVMMNDVFHTSQLNVRLDMGNYIYTQYGVNGEGRDNYDPQTLTVSLRYAFNASKSKYHGTGAGADTRSRM